MQELKVANVDVVVTIGYPSAAAAKASGIATVIATGSGDPVGRDVLLLVPYMSALGHMRTLQRLDLMSALPPKADNQTC
jgi:putative tryptophan/tyrosine transport system substrate-binding protein